MLRQSLGLTKGKPTPSARQKKRAVGGYGIKWIKKITLLAKLDWYCFCTGPSYDGIGAGELVGALMGMPLIALASAALADPARLPPLPPRHRAHLVYTSVAPPHPPSPRRHHVTVLPSRPPSSCHRRAHGRRRAAALGVIVLPRPQQPPRLPLARACRHCAAEPLAVVAPTRHRSVAVAAAAAIAAAAHAQPHPSSSSHIRRRRAAMSAVERDGVVTAADTRSQPRNDCPC